MNTTATDLPPGTHVLGEHTLLVIRTAERCWPENTTPDQADHLLDAVLQCIDLAGGVTQATRPRAASPTHPAFANRTRANQGQAAPMNPVSRHHGTGASRRPPSDSDSAFWLNEYQRVSTHFDRCEVVRRAAEYLATLIHRDPDAPTRVFTEADQLASALLEGRGWPLEDVARKHNLPERTLVLARIDKGLHPLTGVPWTPPQENAFAARDAREMRARRMTNVDIASALGRNASTVREWTTNRRQAA